MQTQPPFIDGDEVQGFAFSVGKTIQNYGTIEYLVNELIALLSTDPLLASHLIRQSISKRINVLDALAKRQREVLAKRGYVVNDALFTSARSAFRERNKIAHNPFVVREQRAESGKSTVTTGIHVIRYHEAGPQEEWIDRSRLESLMLASRTIVEQFSLLLACCKPI